MNVGKGRDNIQTKDAKNEDKIQFFLLNVEEQRAHGQETKTCFPNSKAKKIDEKL
jgi:hypothetical protein